MDEVSFLIGKPTNKSQKNRQLFQRYNLNHAWSCKTVSKNVSLKLWAEGNFSFKMFMINNTIAGKSYNCLIKDDTVE